MNCTMSLNAHRAAITSALRPENRAGTARTTAQACTTTTHARKCMLPPCFATRLPASNCFLVLKTRPEPL